MLLKEKVIRGSNQPYSWCVFWSNELLVQLGALFPNPIPLYVCSQLLELTENYTPEVSEYKVSALNSAAGTSNVSWFHPGVTTLLTNHVAVRFRRERLWTLTTPPNRLSWKYRIPLKVRVIFSSDANNLSHMLKWCLKLIYQDVKDLFCFFKTGMENVSESSAHGMVIIG